jgi:hypothetical protein
MSNLPEPELDLDLQFLPSWAKQTPAPNRYAKYTGDEGNVDSRRGDSRDRRPARRDGGGMNRDRGPRPGGSREGGGRFSRDSRGQESPRQASSQSEALPPLPPFEVILAPDEKGVESITRQIKATGRAYPLFDIAQIILQKPERQQVKIEATKKADGTINQYIYVCGLDESPWASEAEAVAYVLGLHFGTFYQIEKIATEPPKGTYTFVAQCGMSGVILGPPNYHDYQNQLRKLHAERFSRMPFESFKSRVKIVKDEAIVKKWADDQSWKAEYVCLNVPEPKRLHSRDEVERHFREVHLAGVIKQVESIKLVGLAAKEIKSPGLQRLVRHAWDEQKRFPLKLVTILSQQFASRGLHFFKVNKTITHVSVARPHFLDLEATPVSDGVRKIVEFIGSRQRPTRRQLIEGLTSPMPAAAAPADPAAPPAETQPTPEQTALIADLHWLIHQGHVIEFANGAMELAKKPAPKPVRPEPAPKAESKPAVPAAKVESAPSGAQESTPAGASPETVEAVVDVASAAPDTGVAGESAPAGA